MPVEVYETLTRTPIEWDRLAGMITLCRPEEDNNPAAVRAWRTALLSAGVSVSVQVLPWPAAVAAVGAPGLHFHDLRHTGNMFAAKVPGTTIRDLIGRMGHDSTRAAMIYLHRRAGRGSDHRRRAPDRVR